jgi:integrase
MSPQTSEMRLLIRLGSGFIRTPSATSWRLGRGMSAREIAYYLGHERVSMTQDAYMRRKIAGSAAAEAMADMHPDE